jgi:hypothetical protein
MWSTTVTHQGTLQLIQEVSNGLLVGNLINKGINSVDLIATFV